VYSKSFSSTNGDRLTVFLLSTDLAFQLIGRFLRVGHTQFRFHFLEDYVIDTQSDRLSTLLKYTTYAVSGVNYFVLFNFRRILTEDETRFFMRQLVSAVDHMHRTGIVHR
jgi:serine/threonine protein kinase